MTRQCNMCKRTVLIEALQDPGGICRDCYAEAQIRATVLKKKENNEHNDCRAS